MVILLKTTCLIIWLILMLALLGGRRPSQMGGYREVPLYLDGADDLEGKINDKILHLGPQDRLVIYDSCPAGIRHRVLIHRLLRKNPSVWYCQNLPNH